MSVQFRSHGTAIHRPNANRGDYLITGMNRHIPDPKGVRIMREDYRGAGNDERRNS
jgi:hypothetical protein